tara:strand:- start:168 stop:362 length:195 start_codon:yes stop_codon:yes gene_type:complete
MASAYANLLTEEEKGQFDLHGYLHLNGVIKPERLVAMLEVITHWLTVDTAGMAKAGMSPPPGAV